ncbi:MAG: uroporphyrinogen-III synthase [Pseudomonadales bacterium]|nr:uroporphyrinogen-III synthase [Pseudomonadales bacterium]
MKDKKPLLQSPLNGKTIALSESRQLDVLAALFERRQARVLRVPLVTILDSPDQEAVSKWLRCFIEEPPGILVLLTGEGLRRLVAAADRSGIRQQFIAVLADVVKVCRGPKPGRALKEIGLDANLVGTTPTTEGIIESLKSLQLSGAVVAVQLYGMEPNLPLIEFLENANVGVIHRVAPYIYAADSDAEQVKQLIAQLQKGEVDLLAFTSKSQVKRLFSVAAEHDLQEALNAGLATTPVAAIGPVVERELIKFNVKVSVTPDSQYFMKPLVRAAESLFS